MAYFIVPSDYLMMPRLLNFLFAVVFSVAFYPMQSAYAGSPEDKINLLIEQIVGAETAPADKSNNHIDIKDPRGSYERCKKRWETSGDQLSVMDSVSLQTMQRIKSKQDFLDCMMQVIEMEVGERLSESDKESFLLAVHSQQLRTGNDECAHDDGLLAREQEISHHIGYVQLIVETLLIAKPTGSPPAK